MANLRKQKNFIHALHSENTLALNQKEKQDVVFENFQKHLGTHVPRSCQLNLVELGWLPKDLSHLNLPFSEEEIQKVIMEAPKEKAPGLDEFIVLFFSSYWGIIKQDIIRVVHQFCCLNQQELNFLNQSFVVLIPKKEEPKFVSDFMPISLKHSFAKIITKLLANRLARQLNDLISINQTAFIKKKYIHDNFIYVQEVIKNLHKKKVPSLFIKLDISKAFAIVNWSYLLQVMEHLGFT
jgi:hypothetical protein